MAIKFKTALEPHQVKGVEKLIHIKIGALYMDRGTGKTRTSLELIARRIEAGKVEHVLWLCPCSVKPEIKTELEKHLESGMELFTIAGIESLSSSQRLNFKLLEIVKSKKVYLIVDESNLIKNHRRLRTINIERLAEYCQYKLILNGTPISKCEKDLFAQWYILDWRILGYKSFWSFAANHLEYDDNKPGWIRRVLNVDYLVQKIAPYTYQVTKEECLELPQKNYKTIHFDMTDEQEEEYQMVKSAFLMQLNELEPTTIYRLFTALQHIVSGNSIISNYNQPIRTAPMFNDPLDNPRIQTLISIIERIEGKCIIWCKYTSEIKAVSQILNKHFDKTVEFYGKISKSGREAAVKTFSQDAKYFVANKTCAGYGLNLQFSNNAIYYTNDWDYATRVQSEDRIYRMGQKYPVRIYDIAANDSIDRRILNCLWRKENLIDRFKHNIDKFKDKEYFGRWLDGIVDCEYSKTVLQK